MASRFVPICDPRMSLRDDGIALVSVLLRKGALWGPGVPNADCCRGCLVCGSFVNAFG